MSAITNGVILGALSFLVIGGYLLLKGNAPTFSFAVSGSLGAAMVLAIVVSSPVRYGYPDFIPENRCRSCSFHKAEGHTDTEMWILHPYDLLFHFVIKDFLSIAKTLFVLCCYETKLSSHILQAFCACRYFS